MPVSQQPPLNEHIEDISRIYVNALQTGSGPAMLENLLAKFSEELKNPFVASDPYSTAYRLGISEVIKYMITMSEY